MKPLTSEAGQAKDSYRLTTKGWLRALPDRVLLVAPCKGCGVMLTVRRSGTGHRCEQAVAA